MIAAHLHGGPLAGQTVQVGEYVNSFAVMKAHSDGMPYQGSIGIEGSYVKDQSSAGGRCFDWKIAV